MTNQINGILMMALGVILAILYFALPTFLLYTYWLAVIIIVGYGFYTYQKRGEIYPPLVYFFRFSY